LRKCRKNRIKEPVALMFYGNLGNNFGYFESKKKNPKIKASKNVIGPKSISKLSQNRTLLCILR
jgi:hypothetical protein